MTDKPRLIEYAFPLKQTSLDSVHEKNVRHGHISTLHIWPARRPLAACRAALIATLLPDPGTPEERKRLCERIGGKVVSVVKKKKLPSGKVIEEVKEETVGGILHWGRESSPDMDWFREEIKKAYGGRAPKVLDPFAGGGAIPLEAMRLGCEATAIDINPVAWFILKCTLEYPQKLAGQRRPLPDFALKSPEFMETYFRATEKLTKRQMQRNLDMVQGRLFPDVEADLSWHVRAWGWWVLRQARKELAKFYPTYADWEPVEVEESEWESREPRLVPLGEGGAPDDDALNAELGPDYLRNRQNPRWVAKRTIAYLWTRTVQCSTCRGEIPLLKTRWLSKKPGNRALLRMQSEESQGRVSFSVRNQVATVGTNSAQRREHDRKIGEGTMSRSGANCPLCRNIMTMENIRLEGQAGRMSARITAVVVDGQKGREYRDPTELEARLPKQTLPLSRDVYSGIPHGAPFEPTPKGGGRGACRAFSVQGYGILRWADIFTDRQLLALGTMVRAVRSARDEMAGQGYPDGWIEAVSSFLAISIDKLADRQSTLCRWDLGCSKVNNTFTRFALPIVWDFCEANPLSDSTGNYLSCLEWGAEVAEHCAMAADGSPLSESSMASAIEARDKGCYDLVVTDPPYYDAIPYSDLMDFFYVWLRRSIGDLAPCHRDAFSRELSPKWDADKADGELIDDDNRQGGDAEKSKSVYEDGMFRAFQNCHDSLVPDGHLVIVFAHKQPDAWETLASAIMRAGFVVNGSWPIQTEMGNRQRALSSAALSSSVWLVCKKRPENARPGWDNKVLEEMRANIPERMRDFWDAGVRGPDFVWAATGPALEAYSKHPVVKKANAPGELMTVSEFLQHVRRIVVDFVVGRVLSKDDDTEAVTGLDDVTTYYLLHRNDFGLTDAPAGPCILYAVSCGLSDKALADQFDILERRGGVTTEDTESTENEDGEEEGETEEGTGSTLRLKSWKKRNRKNMGFESPASSVNSVARPPALIDQVHRIMHFWKDGDVVKVDEYVDSQGLRRNALFHQLLQALIELAEAGGEERSLLESISNYFAGRGGESREKQKELFAAEE